jgi:hypothetical protein
MVLRIEDGTNWYVSELLAGNTTDSKGTKLNFSLAPGSTNSYIATAPLNDGTGRNQIFRFDNLTNSKFVTVSRKVE